MSVARINIESVLKKNWSLASPEKMSDRKLYNLIINFMNCRNLKEYSFEDLKRKKEIGHLPIPLEDQLLLYQYALEFEYYLDLQ